MRHIQLGANHFEDDDIKWGQRVGKIEPHFWLSLGLFEPKLSQKANTINFGNRNGKK